MAATVDLQELLQSYGDHLRESVRVALPAVVTAYDAAKQVAECRPVVREPFVGEDGATTFEELPTVPDVPVLWPGGGGFHVHFPLDAGDHVLLVFSDVATGVWRASGEPSEPGDLRRHHLSSCFAVPGVRHDAQALSDAPASGEAAIVAPGGGTVRVSKSGASGEFVALAALVQSALDSLQAAFDAHTHVVATTGTAAAQSGTAAPVASPVGPLGPVASSTLKSD
jgi:hypothetical protein